MASSTKIGSNLTHCKNWLLQLSTPPRIHPSPSYHLAPAPIPEEQRIYEIVPPTERKSGPMFANSTTSTHSNGDHKRDKEKQNNKHKAEGSISYPAFGIIEPMSHLTALMPTINHAIKNGDFKSISYLIEQCTDDIEYYSKRRNSQEEPDILVPFSQRDLNSLLKIYTSLNASPPPKEKFGDHKQAVQTLKDLLYKLNGMTTSNNTLLTADPEEDAAPPISLNASELQETMERIELQKNTGLPNELIDIIFDLMADDDAQKSLEST